MKDFLIRVVGNCTTCTVLWALFIAYQWWSNDWALEGKYSDPKFYAVLVPCVVVVSVVQTLVEIREDRADRRRLEGEW